MNLIIASNNQHKIEEIKTILQGKFRQIYCLADFGIDCDPEETGKTFAENAAIKVKAVWEKVTTLPQRNDLALLADDTGLCVDALDGRPGVNSARYAGNHDNAANRRKLLLELDGVTNRSAHFESAVVLMYPDGTTVTACGRVDGYILQQEDGTNGFGYDCLFFCTELNKSFGTATAEEKNAISHRGRALQQLLTKI